MLAVAMPAGNGALFTRTLSQIPGPTSLNRYDDSFITTSMAQSHPTMPCSFV